MMKAYIFLIVFLLGVSIVQAQNKAWQNVFGDLDNINPSYLKALEAARIFRSDDYRFIVSIDDGKYFANNRSGKTYNKVVFNINGDQLYAAAKINYLKTKSTGRGSGYHISKIEVLPQSDVRYLESNQLYCALTDMDIQEPYRVNFKTSIYHTNGSLKYANKLQANSDDVAVEAYNQVGNLYLRFPITRANGNYNISDFTKALSPWLFNAAVSKTIGQIVNGNTVGSYKGSPHLGVFTLKNGEQYSGFFGPVVSMPQGSVLFRKTDDSYEWVLVVGGNIEKIIPAKAAEMPNLLWLQQQLAVVAYTGDFMFKNGTQSANFPYPELLGNYSTNPVNGYGVKYTTSASPTPAKELLFEVGLFKNGQLEGLGYRLKGNTNFWGTTTASPLVFNLYAEAGLFANGKLVDGREFSPGMFYGKKDVDPYRNIWAKSPIPGFTYLQTNVSPIDTLQFYEKIPQSEINFKSNPKVFIEKLNRWVNVLGVDKDKKLVVKGDERNVVLDKNIGNVYYQSEFSKPIRVGCSKTKVVKKYKNVTEDVYWKDTKGRTIITDQDRSGYLKPIKIYTSKKQVLDGYETVTCTICNGQGYYNSSTREKVMYRLDLSANDLYNRVSNALKSVFDEPENQPTAFATPSHLQFEAESFLKLFANAETRTYDQINKYNHRLQYQWIQTAQNTVEIYTAFADLFYLIYQKDKNASYYFIANIHKNSFKESLAIVTKKYPEARAYIAKMANQKLGRK